MSKKVVLLAAGATAVLWACSSENTERTVADAEPTAPSEAPLEDEPNPSSAPVETTNESENDEPVRTATAHVHGKANLALVLEGSTLTIELESAMYNLVGFEHAPETEDQIATIEAAEYKLSAPANLFVMNTDAGCIAQTDKLEIQLGDAHDEDHGAHGEDEHEHDEHEHADHANTHRDAFLTYTFECASPDKLPPITIELMSQFPNLTELDVVYLARNTQDLFSLTPTNNVINLRP